MCPLVRASRTRGHSLRLNGCTFRKEMRRNFFSQGVVNLWNPLPQMAVEVKSLDIFKAQIDRF